jgi:hypothetical protein
MNVLETRRRLVVGKGDEGAAKLQPNRIQCVVECGAAQFDIAADLGVAQRDRALVFAAVAEFDVAVGMEVARVDFAVDGCAGDADEAVGLGAIEDERARNVARFELAAG